jgi:hypothetical protein
VAPERPQSGDCGVERGVAEPLGVRDRGAGVGQGCGGMKGRLREGTRGVGERPGDSLVAAKSAAARKAPHGVGVEAEAERLVPVLLFACREDERSVAVAAGPVGVDVEVARDLAAEELAPGVAADGAGREVGAVVGVVDPRGAEWSGGPGARQERDASEERMVPCHPHRSTPRHGGPGPCFHSAGETERPAPCPERAGGRAMGSGLLQTGAGTRPGGADSALSSLMPAAGAGGVGSVDCEARVLAFVA